MIHKRSFFTYVLACLILFLSIGAFYGGIALVLSPDGSLIGLDSHYLKDIPFKNFFVPGLILLIMLGLFPFFSFIGLLLRPGWKWANIINLYPDMYWAWTYSLYSGMLLIIWIDVQLMYIGYQFFLQSILAFTGIGIVVASLVPGVIRQFKIGPVKHQ